MSTHKHIDRICVIAVVLALLITAIFMNGEAIGIQVTANAMGYEGRLFDTSKVHTIDIVIDDWDTFRSSCQSEEYSVCSVVIDGEAYTNVGIRGKGNTSLSTVASMDSDRYSFKIEFDQYDSSKSYYGLDKLSLNNLIQDNTMMKDYLTYRMMDEFGVAAPLCSYVYITVNGEDWGLYLAVEAVEESFLQRNYGTNYGELYKPDSMNMGGGRGNGKGFNMEDFMGSAEEGTTTEETMPQISGGMQMPGMGGSAELPEDFDPSQMDGMQMPGADGGEVPENAEPSQMGGGMGTDDVKLQYINDDLSSYSNIFSSAKTNVTEADQQRLVKSLRALSGGEQIASVVDVDAVLRYFVVHNYVVNGDSYTGSMIHNYYLYEKDGQLSMIPWDYNLAFGTFQSSNADSAVNDDIDAPLSVTGSGDRPMIDWIYASEEYTELYHQYFQAFLDSVEIQSIIDEAYALIAPYVEKDPTKFCTYEEFETGVAALETFCALRTQSVAAQLSGGEADIDASSLTLSDMGTMNQGMGGGSIQKPQGGTAFPGVSGDDAAQQPSTPTGESGIVTTSFGGGGQQFPGGMEMPQMPTGTDSTDETTPSQDGMQQFPDGMEMPEGMEQPDGMELPEGMEQPDGMGGASQGQAPSAPGTNTAGEAAGQISSEWILLGITLVILAAGLIFAFKFKR